MSAYREAVEQECERTVEGATDPCVWDDDGEMAKCVAASRRWPLVGGATAHQCLTLASWGRHSRPLAALRTRGEPLGARGPVNRKLRCGRPSRPKPPMDAAASGHRTGVGARGKISELDASLQGAKIEFDVVGDEWWFPFSVLSRDAVAPSSA